MSELQQEAPRRWRRFSEEFKRDAVRLVVDEGYTFKAAAAAVGVGDQSLRAWHVGHILRRFLEVLRDRIGRRRAGAGRARRRRGPRSEKYTAYYRASCG